MMLVCTTPSTLAILVSSALSPSVGMQQLDEQIDVDHLVLPGLA